MIAKLYKPYLASGVDVLDIGCGNGEVSDYFLNKFEIKLVGTDIDQYLKKKIEFKKMTDLEKLPFPDKQFKVAMFNDVLHHTECIEKLIAESLRVAETVLIFEMQGNFWARLIDKGINWFHRPQMPVPLNFKNKKQWNELLTKLNCNYKVEAVKKPFIGYPLEHLFIVVNSK
ncbi:class I SAM-dependent methyltransferase [Candidatus Falkowbacteria bacterium]|nr:class I SAM-dependent methyltransferase [Candidatus Falkowbacteria bacterium]MBT5503649.1 class I SAM-dependent methyltransferase [Candidatus Falkowbacteria bacterium]MBT6574113.1 class I SAM-dependent methyltransferase [Candidatus Falkowbacteria bacterium]MBT7500681.1 class I SAM-dependent methyltransferase [Candidatus Falkowbacteria bacterium]